MKLRTWLVRGRALLFAAALAVCASNIFAQKVSGAGTFTDKRDGQKYRTVKISNHVWMAENLRYKIGDSWCYGNDDSKCQQYGRLYDWNTAKTACPSGWHLPSPEEWNNLVTSAKGDVAGRVLKSVSGGWKDGGKGLDGYGFSALPGGCRNAYGSFDGVGSYGNWWTAAERGASFAYSRNMNYDDDNVNEDHYYKETGFSVRCVGD
jgi:uncharacterized protein (TIGR02145 family)